MTSDSCLTVLADPAADDFGRPGVRRRRRRRHRRVAFDLVAGALQQRQRRRRRHRGGRGRLVARVAGCPDLGLVQRDGVVAARAHRRQQVDVQQPEDRLAHLRVGQLGLVGAQRQLHDPGRHDPGGAHIGDGGQLREGRRSAVHLGHLRVAVAHRIGQRGRRSGTPEENERGLGRRSPIAVVAGHQDFVALRIDALHPELARGDRERPGQPGRETARHVLDDVRRKDVAEQFFPRGIRLGERDHRLLAALERLHACDEVVPGGVDHAGLADHLSPQVPEVVGGDGGVVGPLRLRPDLVDHRERVLVGDFGGLQQGGVHLPARTRRRAGVGHRPERAGQHQRADRRVHRGQIGQQVRVEAGADRVDPHDDLRRPRRRRW